MPLTFFPVEREVFVVCEKKSYLPEAQNWNYPYAAIILSCCSAELLAMNVKYYLSAMNVKYYLSSSLHVVVKMSNGEFECWV